MSVVNVYSVEVETMVADVPCSFKLHYKIASGSPAGFPALDLVNIFSTTCLAPLLAVLSSSVQVMRIIGRCLTPTDGIAYEANFDDTNVGTGNAETLAPSIAALLSIISTSDNSRNNGHIYIAGIPENVWVNGAWESIAFVPLVYTLIGVLNVPLPISAGAVTYAPVVVSRYLNNVKRVPPVTFDVQAIELDAQISQQRRRQSGKQGIKS